MHPDPKTAKDLPASTFIQTARARERVPGRELACVILAWLALAIMALILTRQNTTAPGLYYDEALIAGMAKDFLAGHTRGEHIPGHETISVLGRPFPTYISCYEGALKSWMIMPAFKLFGAKLSVFRLASLGWGLLALLLFMLWTWQLLGCGPAIVAGALLAMDPSFLFTNLFDWGQVGSSFLCRLAALYLTLLWWRSPRAVLAGFAGLFWGLGFFNKIDFIVVLGGLGLATAICYGQLI